MSFRIDDILKDNKMSCKEVDNSAGNFKARQDQRGATPENLLETDKSNLVYRRDSFDVVDLQPHYLPYIGTQSLDLTLARDRFRAGYLPYHQTVASCCSRILPQHSNEKPYTMSYVYPEKIYPQTTYNHVVPLSFPIYNHYSKRRNQVRFSTSQTKALEHKFSWQKYLSPEDRKLLAYSLKLSDRQVKTWFQNRRAKWRRNISGSSSEANSHISSSAN